MAATTFPRPTAPLPSDAVRAAARIEQALAAPERAKAVKVGQFLGFRAGWKPNEHLGETATFITRWTQHELNDVFEQVGGTVTTRRVQRTACDGDAKWAAIEITLTVEVPGVGYVEVATDWDEPAGGHDLPVIRAISHGVVPASPAEVAAEHRECAAQYREMASHVDTLCGSDFDRMLCAVDEMGHCRTILAEAGQLSLIGGA